MARKPRRAPPEKPANTKQSIKNILTMEEDSYEALKGKAYAYFDLENYEKSDEFFKKANFIKFLDDESKERWDICLEKLN